MENKEYLLCSAIHFNDGKVYHHQPKNIETGFVVTGRRHHNCYATLSAIGEAIGLEERVKTLINRIDRDYQGFITNLNRYVDRKEGFKIALEAGQIRNSKLYSYDGSDILISEELY